MDLSFTADGDLVCCHRGSVMQKRLGLEQPLAKMTTTEFLKHRCDGRFGLMDLATLLRRVSARRGAYIVTDTKNAFRPSLEKVVETAEAVDPRLVGRIIPQFYQPRQWREVAEVEAVHGPFATVIFTLYRTKLDDDAVVAFVRNRRVPVVTMSRKRFNPDLVKRLTAAGVDVMVHTVNGEAAVRSYLSQGVRGVYTDDFFSQRNPAQSPARTRRGLLPKNSG